MVESWSSKPIKTMVIDKNCWLNCKFYNQKMWKCVDFAIKRCDSSIQASKLAI